MADLAKDEICVVGSGSSISNERRLSADEITLLGCQVGQQRSGRCSIVCRSTLDASCVPVRT